LHHKIETIATYRLGPRSPAAPQRWHKHCVPASPHMSSLKSQKAWAAGIASTWFDLRTTTQSRLAPRRWADPGMVGKNLRNVLFGI